MEQLTNSRIRAFRRCPRLHYFAYEIRRRPLRTTSAMGFGTLFHAGLEAWWNAVKDDRNGEAISLALAAIDEGFESASQEAGLDQFDNIKAQELMFGYQARWAEVTRDLEVLGVESQFDRAIFNPHTGWSSKTYTLAGKLDALARIKSLDRVVIVEHKTTTADIEPGSDYWQRLRMDGQISTYHDGAKALGVGPTGCIYDVARRPTLRPYKATPEEERKYSTKASRFKDGSTRPAGSLYAGQRERDESPAEYRDRLRCHIIDNPDAYYQRGEVVRLEKEMNEFRLDLWETAKALRERQLSGRTLGPQAWPRNSDACDRWGHRCEYWDVCTGAASIDNDDLFRSAESQHEELALRPDQLKIVAS